MMIKKQLGVLAGAVMLASGAQAAFNVADNPSSPNSTYGGFQAFAGTDGDLFFWATDSNDVNGSVFVNLNQFGITVDSVLSGATFSQDLGVDLSDYDTWGLAGASADLETTYSYRKAGIALGGLFATSGTPTGTIGGAESAADAIVNSVNIWSQEINASLGGADTGTVSAADPADYNNNGLRLAGNFNGSSIGEVANLWFYGILDDTPEGTFAAPAGSNLDTTVAFTQLQPSLQLSVIGSSLEYSEVPVPAAAWLFGSALVGLGVVRRKK